MAIRPGWMEQVELARQVARVGQQKAGSEILPIAQAADRLRPDTAKLTGFLEGGSGGGSAVAPACALFRALAPLMEMHFRQVQCTQEH